MTNQTLRKRLKMPEQHCRGMKHGDSKVTGGDVAAVQRSAIAATANVVARIIAPLHIIL
jgi:hypothetical protein